MTLTLVLFEDRLRAVNAIRLVGFGLKAERAEVLTRGALIAAWAASRLLGGHRAT